MIFLPLAMCTRRQAEFPPRTRCSTPACTQHCEHSMTSSLWPCFHVPVRSFRFDCYPSSACTFFRISFTRLNFLSYCFFLVSLGARLLSSRSWVGCHEHAAPFAPVFTFPQSS
jgi:hypothetical protein